MGHLSMLQSAVVLAVSNVFTPHIFKIDLESWLAQHQTHLRAEPKIE